MKSLKQVIFGIIIIFSQSVFADTCYDPDHNAVQQSFFTSAFISNYTYMNLQGWDVQGDWPIMGQNALGADSMIFQYASYSPVTGLHCTYRVRTYDRNAWNLGPDSSIDRNIDLIKQAQYIESDFADHTGWVKDFTTGIYKCVNDHIEACAFK